MSMLSEHKSNSTYASNALRSKRLGDRVSPGARRGLPHPSPITPGGYPAYPSFSASSRSLAKVLHYNPPPPTRAFNFLPAAVKSTSVSVRFLCSWANLPQQSDSNGQLNQKHRFSFVAPADID